MLTSFGVLHEEDHEKNCACAEEGRDPEAPSPVAGKVGHQGAHHVAETAGKWERTTLLLVV